MSSQRYARIAAQDSDEPSPSHPLPTSPPPSFRSHASSRRPSRDDTHRQSEEERDLNAAFDAPSDDESDGEHPHDEQRLMPGNAPPVESPVETGDAQRPSAPQRTMTELPRSAATASRGRTVGNSSHANDGVFANLSAKPRPGEDLEEKPPTYEQAAADATPPYWETTVLSPYSTMGNPDDVFVNGLLVGSLFSFVWNALISMSFQLIGFLLTYLLHTTHAAKHGSRTGLGITFIQYGFQMRYAANRDRADPAIPAVPVDGLPDDPNSHDFDPGTLSGAAAGNPSSSGLSTSDWLSYVLMIVGWFILIRAVSDFLRARRQEALVRSSPERGLGVAVVAEGENPESSV